MIQEKKAISMISFLYKNIGQLLSKRLPYLSDIVTSEAQLHVADSNERAMRIYQRAEFKDV